MFSHNSYACYRSQRVHCGAPTGVGDRVRVRAPEARLGYRMFFVTRTRKRVCLSPCFKHESLCLKSAETCAGILRVR